MNIDPVQVGANLIVGAVSAWVAGSFGVRHGLQRAQRERAFERRLSWFEDAIRVTFRFKYLVDSVAIAMRESNLVKSEQIMKPLVEQSEEISRDLVQTINDSLLYATREVYVALKKVFAQVTKLTVDLGVLLKDKADDKAVAVAYESHSKILDESLYLLAKSVRKLLKMDKISREDFDEDFDVSKLR
jgi:hypothetical protein